MPKSPIEILPVSFFFSVEILGLPAANASAIEAGFEEVSGINTTMNVENITEGGENGFVHKVPGRLKYDSNLELKRGLITGFSPFGLWCRSQLSGGANAASVATKIVTHNVIVHLLNANQIPVMSWVFVGAYPVKWDIKGFNSRQSEIAVETLALAYRYFYTL